MEIKLTEQTLKTVLNNFIISPQEGDLLKISAKKGIQNRAEEVSSLHHVLSGFGIKTNFVLGEYHASDSYLTTMDSRIKELLPETSPQLTQGVKGVVISGSQRLQ